MSRDLEALRELAVRHNVGPSGPTPPSSPSPNRLSAAVARASAALEGSSPPAGGAASGGGGAGERTAAARVGGGINSLKGGAARLGRINARYPSLKRPVGGGGANGGEGEAGENDGSAGNGSPAGVNGSNPGAGEGKGTAGGAGNGARRSNFSSLVSKFGGSASGRVGGGRGGGNKTGPGSMSPQRFASPKFGGPPGVSGGQGDEEGGGAKDAAPGPRPPASTSPFPQSPAVDDFAAFPPDTPDDGEDGAAPEEDPVEPAETPRAPDGEDGGDDDDEPDMPDSPIFDSGFFDDSAELAPEPGPEEARGVEGGGPDAEEVPRSAEAPAPPPSGNRRLPSLRDVNPVAALAKQARRAGAAASARSGGGKAGAAGGGRPLSPGRRTGPAAAGGGGDVPPPPPRGPRRHAGPPAGPPSNPQGGMLRAKSRQRQVLEQLASRHFLNDPSSDVRYEGVSDYGIPAPAESRRGPDGGTDGKFASALGSSGTTLPLGLGADPAELGRLASFLEVPEDGPAPRPTPGELHRRRLREVQECDDIDAILETASDHLSLGRNELAMASYRRAMKVSFADVISVKRRLVEAKRRSAAAAGGGEADLTRRQERAFELSLLQVASRVADVHNNLGVLHELNGEYGRARASYADALEVYHNTCKRYEEAGDPDVDRTKANVERMENACASAGERRELHDRANRLAGDVARERSSGARRELLLRQREALRDALELEGSTIGPSHPASASTLIQMGKIDYELRRYDDAASGIRRAGDILATSLGGNHPRVGRALLLLASIYERRGDEISPAVRTGSGPATPSSRNASGEAVSSDDAELGLYVDALDPLKGALGEVHDEVGRLYARIGHLYGKKGDSSLSLLARKASLRSYGEPLPGGATPEVTYLWVRVVEHLAEQRNWDDAVVAGRRALFLLRRNRTAILEAREDPNDRRRGAPTRIAPGEYDASVHSVLQALGQAHQSRSEDRPAALATGESLRLAWVMALSNDGGPGGEAESDSVLRVCRALKRLGKGHLLANRHAAAQSCLVPALELLRSGAETSRTVDCASVLGSLGFLHLRLRRYAESAGFLRECLRLYGECGVAEGDRETEKVRSWLETATSREGAAGPAGGGGATPPALLEIPTIVFGEEG